MANILPSQSQIDQLQFAINFMQAHPELVSEVGGNRNAAATVLTLQNLWPSSEDNTQKDYSGILIIGSIFIIIGIVIGRFVR